MNIRKLIKKNFGSRIADIMPLCLQWPAAKLYNSSQQAYSSVELFIDDVTLQ